MKNFIYFVSVILLTGLLTFATRSYHFPLEAFKKVAMGCDPSFCGFSSGFMGECLCQKTQIIYPSLIVNILFYLTISLIFVWIISKKFNKN